MKLVASIFERWIEGGWLETCAAMGEKARWLVFFLTSYPGSPPLARLGRRVREPSAHVAGVAGWLLSIITSHAPEDGCNRCAPAIVDGCNGCAPAILPKMAAI